MACIIGCFRGTLSPPPLCRQRIQHRNPLVFPDQAGQGLVAAVPDGLEPAGTFPSLGLVRKAYVEAVPELHEPVMVHTGNPDPAGEALEHVLGQFFHAKPPEGYFTPMGARFLDRDTAGIPAVQVHPTTKGPHSRRLSSSMVRFPPNRAAIAWEYFIN